VDELQKVFSQIRPKVISFGGLTSEPLTNKYLCDLVKCASEYKCKSLITTNGHLLNTEVANRLIDNGIHLIKVSIDAATKETYKRIRQSTRFDKVINNVRRLGDIEKAKRNQRKVIRLEYVIQKDNLDEMIPFIYLAKDLNVSNITFLPMNFIPVSKETELSFKKDYDLEKIMECIRESIKVSSQLGINTNLPFLFRKSHKMKNTKNYDMKDSDLFYFPWYKYSQGKHFFCSMPWIELVININGDVALCCVPFTPGRNGKRLTIGNYNDTNLFDIWNGKKAQQIRRLCATKENYKVFDLCRICVNRPSIIGELRKNKLFSIL